MATLVLSTVGRVFGGPIGAAVGATVGQVIDRELLFKPKREGPRLTELAVQTSAYGTPVAHVFGTMRIGGCVIWSTDLIESRSRSGGKGQPTTTNYAYSASFAVALSGRAIAGVGRIWADGKLLRGVAGDFKSATGFRLYSGGEDQAVDPLIAAAEGTGLAPAHRGMAYAVFENFQLADYGNRIPSLTFEVIGDAGDVSAGAIAAAVTDGLVESDVALPVAGFAAYGDTRAVLELLAAASGAWFAPVAGGLRMVAAAAPSTVLSDDGFAAGEGRGETGIRALAAAESVPQIVTLAHYDPARDYQTGLQRVKRTGFGAGSGRGEQRVELPAALSADAAKTIAAAMLARAEAGRERRTLRLGWGDLAVEPGACVTIDGTAGVWRVAGWSFERMVLSLDCVRLAGASPAASASPGRVLPAPDAVAGTTVLHVFELPALDDILLGAPRVVVAAAGTAPGWRSAALLHSSDGGAWTPAATRGAATMGALANMPGAGPVGVYDLAAWFEVDLLHGDMALAGADDRALDAGVNLALVGDELLQFGVAEQIGPVRWRLSRLWRGRRATEAAIGTQGVGDRFVLIEAEALSAIDLPLATIGADLRVIASGVGDAQPVGADTIVRGASVLPPSPTWLRTTILPGGDAMLSWARRSRAGWRWIDGVDAPLGEEREAYHVTISGGAAVRTIEVTMPRLIVPVAARAIGPVAVSVRQVGSCGESPPVSIVLPGL